MSLLRDIYKLSNYTYKVQDTPERLTFKKGGIDIDEAWYEYGQRENIPAKVALYIGASANEEGYVKGRGPVASRYTVILKPGKGSRLIEKGLLGFPKGLFKAWLEVNHMLTNLLWIIVGAVVGGIAGNIGTIIDVIHRHVPVL